MEKQVLERFADLAARKSSGRLTDREKELAEDFADLPHRARKWNETKKMPARDFWAMLETGEKVRRGPRIRSENVRRRNWPYYVELFKKQRAGAPSARAAAAGKSADPPVTGKTIEKAVKTIAPGLWKPRRKHPGQFSTQ